MLVCACVPVYVLDLLVVILILAIFFWFFEGKTFTRHENTFYGKA